MSYSSGHMPHAPNPLQANSGGYSRHRRSQIARPVNAINYTPRGRTSSSDVGDTLVSVPATKRSAPRGSRLSMLPRTNTGSTISSDTPVAVAPCHNSAQPVSLVSSSEKNPSLCVTAQDLPSKRAPNALRRRAPTIGQHGDKYQPNKLSLALPRESQGSNTKEALTHRQSASTYKPDHKNDSSVTIKSADSSVNGPKELASLRTVVATQNPPFHPTPVLSASSPSTRCSESPSIWSRVSTPASLSSFSPGIFHCSKTNRLRQPSSSLTRLPVFSPPTAHSSPQQGKPDLKVDTHSATANPYSSGPARSVDEGKVHTVQSPSTGIRGAPCSSSQNLSDSFSPSRIQDIDIERAHNEVEQMEAKRRLFDPQGAMECPPAHIAETPQTPRRPSRDGTHRLELETSPIIQSNLHLKPTGHTRRESIEKVLKSQRSTSTSHQSAGASASIDSFHSASLSQISSRDGGSPVSSRKPSWTLIKEVPREKMEPKKIPVSKRFGLFSKKPKPTTPETTAEPARPARKGPAAGTGHEGYGKYRQRGRNGSEKRSSGSSSSGMRTRSTSTSRSATSKGSQSSHPELDIDDFLKSRLEPVIINGGGMDGAPSSRPTSKLSAGNVGAKTTSNAPPRAPLSFLTNPSTDSLMTPTETSDDTLTPAGFEETTRCQDREAHRKSEHLPNISKSRMPVPKGKKHGIFANPQASATNISLSSQLPTAAVVSSRLRRIVQQSPQRSAKSSQVEPPQAKKGKTSMWSFFQKNRGNVQNNGPQKATQTAKLHAAVTPRFDTRPVAHYALVDTDSDELDEIMKNIEDSPPAKEDETLRPVEIPRSLNSRKRVPSILLPSPPRMHGEFGKNDRPSPRTVMFNGNMMPQEPQATPGKCPRQLDTISRIPQVASRRERRHQPAIQSFSRPFSGIESPPLKVPTTESKGEPTPGATLSPDTKPFGSDMAATEYPEWGRGFNPIFSASKDISPLEFVAGPFSTYDLLQFPPKKGSASSDSPERLDTVTALTPIPGSPHTEDEVWNEFDDIIDDVLSPEKPTPSAEETAKTDEEDRFELATMASRALQDELNSAYQPRAAPSSGPTHLNRSRIQTDCQSTTALPSRTSYSDLRAQYVDLDGEKDEATGSTEQSSTTEKRSKDQASSSEREWDAITRTNLRSASLMTSRWLSFGRVLFSPAHNHTKTGEGGRILVVDGLGNDDWSFYCSLAYPDAEVYNLGRSSVSVPSSRPASWKPPINHHSVYHAGLETPLPFPKDYFTVVVLRFPAVCSETIQGSIVQEFKRVLRTGGYLEMTLLDRDMVNMGPQTRKAVRHLKEMTCLFDSSLSLKSTSDSIQRELGAQGFDSLRRCMVRVPVAGMVLRSSGSSSSTGSFSATTPSSRFSLPTISVSTAGSQRTGTPSISPLDGNISLSDLLSDPSPSPANDESIAKIVARVGRWWYSKCYEDPVSSAHPNPSSSIWDDRRLLHECRKRGTGFRMFIAYAQKPSEVPRRTLSV